MRTDQIDQTWSSLLDTGTDHVADFDPSTLAGLPAPAIRWLTHAIPAGSALSRVMKLTMEGEIRLNKRWLPFTADQVLHAGAGFVWQPVVGGRLLRFVGADILGPAGARMEFWLHGLIPVVRASGPGVERSAAGRLAAETVAWLPQALTPQTSTRWTPIDDNRATVHVQTRNEIIPVQVTISSEGQLSDIGLQRWNDSSDPPQLEPFGGTVSGEYVTTSGVGIAGTGSVGWNWGTAAHTDGEFFRYTITSAEPLRSTGAQRLDGSGQGNIGTHHVD